MWNPDAFVANTIQRKETMKNKLLILVCGLACGVVIALGVQAASARHDNRRPPDRRETPADRRTPNDNDNDKDDDDDDDDDRRSFDDRDDDDDAYVERRFEMNHRDDFDDRFDRDDRMELAARDPRGGPPENRGPRDPRRDGDDRPRDRNEPMRHQRGRPGDQRRGREFDGPPGRPGSDRRPPEDHFDRSGGRGGRDRYAERSSGRFDGPRDFHHGMPMGGSRPGRGDEFRRPPRHPEFEGRHFASRGHGRFGAQIAMHDQPRCNCPHCGQHARFDSCPQCGFHRHPFAGHGHGRFEDFGSGHWNEGHGWGGPHQAAFQHFGPPMGHLQGGAWPHGRFRGAGPAGSPFGRLDTDADGKITKDEVMQLFDKADLNSDGAVSREEFVKSVMASRAGAHGSGTKNDTPPAKSDDAAHDAPNGHHSGDHPAGPPHGFGGGPGGMGPGGPGGFGPGGFRPGRRGGGVGPGGFGRQGRPSADELFQHFDPDHKGKLTKDDVPAPVWEHIISKADADGDGAVTKEELDAHFKKHQPGAPHGNDPHSKPQDSPKEEKPADDKPQAKTANDDAPADADVTVLTSSGSALANFTEAATDAAASHSNVD